MSEYENKSNFPPGYKQDLWEQDRRERRALKHAVRKVFDRRARKEIVGDEVGIAMRDMFLSYIKDNLAESEDGERLVMYDIASTRISVDASGNPHYKYKDQYWADYYGYSDPDRLGFWVGYRQSIIRCIVGYSRSRKFNE